MMKAGKTNGSKRKSQPITKQMVWEAYLVVKRNGGSAGIDQMDLEDLEKDLVGQLYKLWNRMTSGSYFPPPVKEVEIPKDASGKQMRKLGIPTVLDRIAQTVVKNHMEPLLDPIFHVNSFGYRPNKSAHEALDQARRNCWKYDWVIDLDIKGFFDHIDHLAMQRLVEKYVDDKWVWLYVDRWLKADRITKEGKRESRDRGTPQGGVVSPLLANLYLHVAFDKWMENQWEQFPFERYADDIIVHCHTESEAKVLLEQIKHRLSRCELELNEEKSRIVYCRDSNRTLPTRRPKKFTFLGYDFKPRKSYNKKKGRAFTSFSPGIGKKATKKITRYLASLAIPRSTGSTLVILSTRLNAKLRGWINYYGRFWKTAMKWIFINLNFRLVRWAASKYKKFSGSYRKATRWLRAYASHHPKLFAHWEAGFRP